jgi:hypothetical protein
MKSVKAMMDAGVLCLKMATLVTALVLCAGCTTVAFNELPTRSEMDAKTCGELKATYGAFVRYETRRSSQVRVANSGGLNALASGYPSIAPLLAAWGEPSRKPAVDRAVWDFKDKCVEASTTGSRVVRLRLYSRFGEAVKIPVQSQGRTQVVSAGSVPAATPPADSNDELVRKLKNLKSLYDEQILTEDEYQSRRRAIVDKL